MTTKKQRWSFQRYWELLRLRQVGCPVEYPTAQEAGSELRIAPASTYFNTNFFSVEEGTALVVRLDMYTPRALMIQALKFVSPGLEGPLCLLSWSDKHKWYYCLPPGLWIAGEDVLNHYLSRRRVLPRGQHLQGFLLATFAEPIPAHWGEEVEALLGVEDMCGYDHTLPITLINRPLHPDVLHTHGEKATFPPPPPEKEAPLKDTQQEPPWDKTQTVSWKVCTRVLEDEEPDVKRHHLHKENMLP